MFEGNELEDLDKIAEQRKNNYFLFIIATATTMVLVYLNFIPLALGSLIIAVTSHTNIRYWDTKKNIMKYSSKGGKNK